MKLIGIRLNRRRIGNFFCGVAIATVVMFVAGLVLSDFNVFGRNITVTVTCGSGAPVEGIYAAAETNTLWLNSDWVKNWRVDPDHPNIAQAAYWARFGGPIEFRFGCGGTPQVWRVANDPGYSGADSLSITCDDPTASLDSSHNTDCTTS